MGIFDFLKKPGGPYKDPATNSIYELLFCDNPDLYKANQQKPFIYPWDILFSETANADNLQKIIADPDAESRVKVLAYKRLSANAPDVNHKDLLAVIVEVGLYSGLDVLASFGDGTARYINQTGKMIFWDTKDERLIKLTDKLFRDSTTVVNKIGPWDKPRRPAPEKGVVRISFLVSGQLYFGEGPMNVLFNDPLAAPALASATEVMKYLVENSESKS